MGVGFHVVLKKGVHAVVWAKEAPSLGTLSKLGLSNSQANLPYVIDLTILNAMTISLGSYGFQFLHR